MYFLTGYPGFISKRLIRHIARQDPGAKISVLVLPKQEQDAHRELERSGVKAEVLTGDAVDMHLGLSGEEYQRLCDQVTDIFHLAALSYLGVSREAAWRTNVDGTRNVIELAQECKHLRRLSHFSTCYVSGDRLGVIAEDELDCGQAFRNPYEETKFHAEKLVRRAAEKIQFNCFVSN